MPKQPRITEEALEAANHDPLKAILLILDLITQGHIRCNRQGLKNRHTLMCKTTTTTTTANH